MHGVGTFTWPDGREYYGKFATSIVSVILTPAVISFMGFGLN